MTADITDLQGAWAKFTAYFWSASLEGRIYTIAISLILALALFQLVRQLVRHSVLRYYLLPLAAGAAVGLGYGVFVSLNDVALPKHFSLNPSQTTTVETIAGTMVGLCAGMYMIWLIFNPKASKRMHRRKIGKDNLATTTGDFGNTQADPTNPNWKSDRSLIEDIVDSYRPDGRLPTDAEVGLELMSRRELRGKSKPR